jgi:hypothetical protein
MSAGQPFLILKEGADRSTGRDARNSNIHPGRLERMLDEIERALNDALYLISDVA